ncbi:MAG: M28 family peptidase, partial [Pirellulales bacterium]|nr:M28 family peptidase [Pirellulales bacterium]
MKSLSGILRRFRRRRRDSQRKRSSTVQPAANQALLLRIEELEDRRLLSMGKVDKHPADGVLSIRPGGAKTVYLDSGSHSYSNSATLLADTQPPVVSSVTRLDPSPTALASVRFGVVVSEPVTGVTPDDFEVFAVGPGGSAVSGVSGSGAEYTVIVETGTGEGTLRLDVIDDGSIRDLANNKLGGPQGGDDFTSGEVYAVDKTAPSATSILRADADPTSASSVRFTVSFSESVNGVDAGDFQVATSGLSGAAISGISGSGSSYTVTVSTGAGEGTLRLDLVDDDTIVDTAGNPLGGPGVGNGSRIGDQFYTVDTLPPQVVWVVRADANPTASATARFNVAFSESVSNVDVADFALTTTGTFTGAAVTGVSGSASNYTVTIGTGAGEGTLRLDVVDNDTIQDARGNPLGGSGAGNGNYPGGQFYTVDTLPPQVVSIFRADANPATVGLMHFTVTFRESVTGVNQGDFQLVASGLSGATISSVTGSGTTYTVTAATGTGNGTLGLNLADNDSIVDAMGNRLGGTGSNNGSASGEVYTILPTVQFTSTGQYAHEGGGAISIAVQLSGASAADVVVPFTLAGTAASPADYTISPNPLTIPAGQTTATAALSLADDLLDEGAETAIVTLGDPFGAIASGTTQHTVTIVDNDAAADGTVDVYALLISGTSGSSLDPIVAFHDILTDQHGIAPSQITYLVVGYGIPPGYEGVVDGTATAEMFFDALFELARQVDGDDVLLVNIEAHGSGYLGLGPEHPYNAAYHGYSGVGPQLNQVGNPDEFDFLESGYEFSVFCGSGVKSGSPPFFDLHAGLGQWVTDWHPDTDISRWMPASHYENVYVDGLGLLSDNDEDIDRFIDYTLGDLNHNGLIDTGAGEVWDYDGDGVPPYNRFTGAFDEDDWGPIDAFENDDRDTHSPLIGIPFRIFDAGLDDHLDIDVYPAATGPLEVDGTDLDNSGTIDGIDLNDDGDMIDWVAINETISLWSRAVTDDEVAAIFNPISAGAKVFINNTCHSGGFVNDLSGPKTIVMTGSMELSDATAGVFPRELNQAFGQYRGEADADGSGRVSMAEAFNYAERHPHKHLSPGLDLFQYDDNGDRLPHDYPLPNQGDGAFGATVFLPERPVLDLDADDNSSTGSGYQATLVVGRSSVPAADADAALSDLDGANLVSLTATITNLQDAPAEWLDADVAGTLISKSFNPATGVLALTGLDTVANYQKVLRTVIYGNSAAIPTTDPSREIRFVVNDGRADSHPVAATIALIPPAEIHGTKYNDLDGDGVRDTGEPGLPGWTVYADLSANGLLDNGEPASTTDVDGRYALTILGPGAYLVAEQMQDGWRQTFPGKPGATVKASIALGGALANQPSYRPAISDDGRFVTFESFAGNLVPGDTNGELDIFVFDRQAGTVERVSVSSTGAQAETSCYFPAISADGRYVTFSTSASLASDDTDGVNDTYIHDRVTHTTERVSVSSDGTATGGYATSSVSADGRYVAFLSRIALVAGDTNDRDDVYVRDRVAGTTERVSIASDGTPPLDYSSEPAISADGRYVVFSSPDGKLVPGDTGGHSDIFLHDRESHTTGRVSVSSEGSQGDNRSIRPRISADGRNILFLSDATNLVPEDTNASTDVFLYDRETRTTTRLSVASDGSQISGFVDAPVVSATGRYVAFVTESANLVPGDTNNQRDLFVLDRSTNRLARVNLAPDGSQANNRSDRAAVSADGRYIAFDSLATNLAAGDTGISDVFVTPNPLADPAGPQVVYAAVGETVAGIDLGNINLLPVVVSIRRADATPTRAATVDFLVTFSEPVSGVDAADFAVIAGGLTGLGIGGIAGNGTSYTVTVTTGSGEGMLRLDLVDNDTIVDSVGEPLGGAGLGNGNLAGDEVYTVDTLPPQAVSVVRLDANPTGVAAVRFAVVFSESVMGVDAADFALAATGTLSGAAITGVSGAGGSYTVTVATGTGDGTLRLDVIDDDTIHDGVQNVLGGPGTGNGSRTGDELYTINSLPTVATPIPDLTVDEDAADWSINLGDVFTDPGLPDDALTYTVAVNTPVSGLVNQITVASYTHLHQDLIYTHTGDNRGFGPQHDLARDNIFSYFAGLGLQTSLDPFTYSSQTYYNVVGAKPGAARPNDIYIVGAHYDSLNNPGADDNASGTAGVMEIARVLAQQDFEATLVFIAFDREEQGLFGSTAYAAAAQNAGKTIRGMVSLDMIAYNPAGANHDKVRLYDAASGGRVKGDLAVAFAAYGSGLATVDSGLISASDHAPFDQRGFDAALVIEHEVWSNPYYHQATDAVETAGYIDYAFATKVTRAVAGYLAGAAGVVSTTILDPTIAGELLTLDFAANAGGVAELTVRATDLSGSFAEDTFRVTVNPANDAPAIAHAIPNQSATEDAPFSFTFAADAFSEIDSGDWLKYTATLADGSPLPVWLSFAPAARAFSGIPANADVGTLNVRITAADQNAASAADDFAITIANVNDAPQLDPAGVMTLAGIDQDVPDSSNPGTLVSQIIASAGGDRITDVDAGALEGIAVVAVDNTHGAWQFTTGGSAWTAFGTPSPTAARLLVSDSTTRVRFVPAGGFFGTVDPGVTFLAWDQTAGSNGGTANVSATGGTTAFSTATETAAIAVRTVSSTLTLAINPTTIAETTGPAAAVATLTRTGDLSQPLLVMLTSSDLSEATVPVTVTVPADQASMTFNIDAVDDLFIDGTQTVTITASAGMGPSVKLDAAFGSAGVAATPLSLYSGNVRIPIAVQSDGKIVTAAGQDTTTWKVTRLNPDGSLDTGFGTAGVVTTQLPCTTGDTPDPHSITVQPDGRILVGGRYDGGTGWPVIARYNPDGSLDATFASGGIHELSVSGWIEDITLRSDGKILLAIAYNGSAALRVAQLNGDGSMDTAFGLSSGVTTVDTAGGLTYAIILKDDGRIVLAGTGAGVGRVAVLAPDGKTLDSTFGSGGVQTVTLDGANLTILDAAIDSQGRIVLGGYRWTGTNNQSDMAAVRLNADGSLDTSFSDDGKIVTDLVGLDDVAYAMVLQSDDKIVLAGYGEVADNIKDMALVRYDVNGVLDLSFDDDGRFLEPVIPSYDYERIGGVALQEDGKLLAVTPSPDVYSVVRFDMGQATVVQASDTIDVTDNDVLPTVTLSLTGSPMAEAGGTATVTATLSSVWGQTVTVDLGFSGAATLTSDYTRSGTQIVIPAGSTTGSITLTAVQDTLDEPNETIVVDVASVTNATESGTQQVTATITDDDSPPTVRLSPTNQSIAEAAGTATVTATLSAASGYTVTVTLGFSGTATNSSDYTRSSTQIVIPAGSTSGSITLTAVQDTRDETDETIVVDITGVTNGSEYLTQTATVTILDDDPPPTVTLSLSGSPMAEAGGVATVTATLSAASGRSVTVNLGFLGTATYSSDYTRSSTQIVIPSGSTTGSITLTAVQDTLDEANETIVVDITSVTNATESGVQQVTATIADDDPPPMVGLSLSGSPMAEAAGAATVTATMSVISGQAVTVFLGFSGTATLTSDYTRSGGTQITIAAGNTTGSITLTAVQDTADEPNETIVVDMTSVTNGTEWGTQQVTALIIDDDGPPTVVATTPTISGGVLAPGTTSIQVQFSEAVNGGAVSGNYQLQTLGPDALLGTLDDVVIPVSAAYAAKTATLTFAAISQGVYRLTVKDTITDLEGNALDGDAIAGAGGNWVGDFAANQLPGVLDPSFDGDGKAATAVVASSDAGAQSVAVQPDGKIVVAGYSYVSGSGNDFAVVRYNADGSLDTSFDGDGKVTTAVGSGTSDDFVYGVAIQSDGKIVVAGYSWNTSVLKYDIALVRYNSNGTLDTSFSGDGKATTGSDASTIFGLSMAIQPDGKIVVAANSYPNGTTQYDFAVVRFNTSGNLDTTFSGDGKLTTDIAGWDLAYGVAVQADGKILVAGSSTTSSYTDFSIVRYSASGTLDTSFDGDGKLTTQLDVGNDDARAIVVQPDGKIVVAGFSNEGLGGPSDFAVARYDANGTLDTSFDGDGKLTTIMSLKGDLGTAMALQPDGKIVVAGYSQNGTGYDFAVARYNPDGSLDSTFDSDGKLTTTMATSDARATSVAIQPDGKIVVAGPSYSGSYDLVAVARYFGSGAMDLRSSHGLLVTVDAGEWGAGQLISAGAGANGLDRLQVGGSDFAPSTSYSMDDGGRTVVTAAATLSGLNVHREITVPGIGNEDFARYVDVFENPTASPITTTV